MEDIMLFAVAVHEIHIALWLAIPAILFVIGAIAFIVAFFDREMYGDCVPYHSDLYVLCNWVCVLCFLIGISLVGGHYLSKIDLVVR